MYVATLIASKTCFHRNLNLIQGLVLTAQPITHDRYTIVITLYRVLYPREGVSHTEPFTEMISLPIKTNVRYNPTCLSIKSPTTVRKRRQAAMDQKKGTQKRRQRLLMEYRKSPWLRTEARSFFGARFLRDEDGVTSRTNYFRNPLDQTFPKTP